MSDPVPRPIDQTELARFQKQYAPVGGLHLLWSLCDGIEVEAQGDSENVFVRFYSMDDFLDMLIGYEYRERLGSEVVAFAGDGGDLMIVCGRHPVLGAGVYAVPTGGIDWVEARVVKVGATIEDVLFGQVADDIVALADRDWMD